MSEIHRSSPNGHFSGLKAVLFPALLLDSFNCSDDDPDSASSSKTVSQQQSRIYPLDKDRLMNLRSASFSAGQSASSDPSLQSQLLSQIHWRGIQTPFSLHLKSSFWQTMRQKKMIRIDFRIIKDRSRYLPMEVQLTSSELSLQWLDPSQTLLSGMQERPSSQRNCPSPHSWLDGQSLSSDPSAQSLDPSQRHLCGTHRFGSDSHLNSWSVHWPQENSSSPWLQS